MPCVTFIYFYEFACHYLMPTHPGEIAHFVPTSKIVAQMQEVLTVLVSNYLKFWL